MIKCSECNCENKDDAKFCHNCGASLESNSYNIENANGGYGSVNGAKGGDIDTYYNHSANSSSSSSSFSSKAASRSSAQGFREKFEGMSSFKKAIAVCCAVYIVLMILSLLSYAILGIPLEPYTEEESAHNDYSSIDLNGDGALSFDEISAEYTNVSNSELNRIFSYSDKNDNGLIAGREYDNFLHKVDNYFKDLEKNKNKAKSSESNSSAGFSSSQTSHKKSKSSDYSADGAETCPYCGSEALYQSGNSVVCAECGRTIYSADDLDLNYDEGYIDLLLPLASFN